MRDIRDVIEDLLKEKTGKHFLDSGGAYGRHWEENQDRNFRDENELDIEVYGEDVELSLNLYHYLTSVLKISNKSEKLNKELQKYMEMSEDNYLIDMENFAKDKDMYIATENTYNYDTILSQTIQYVIMSEDEDWVYSVDPVYIILQIHNGCDVRGGYTKPQIFEVKNPERFIRAMTSISARDKWGCVDGYSDDCGYNWYDIDIDLWIYDEENNKVYFEDKENELKFYSAL